MMWKKVIIFAGEKVAEFKSLTYTLIYYILCVSVVYIPCYSSC